MSKATFVLTLKLNTQKYQEDVLNKRLDVGRQIYNACLNELFKRYRAMKESKNYQKTLKMDQSTKRTKNFRKINKDFGLTEYSLQKEYRYFHGSKDSNKMLCCF